MTGAAVIPEIDQTPFADRAADPDACIVDVREPDEFTPGHVPGSRNVPLAEVTARSSELPTDRPVYVVCRSGRRSGLATEQLRSAGIEAYNVVGGIDAWQAAGRSVQTGA